ncbi:hypothetical protein R1sor_012140 [Riccia sorocarpa]|uniref:Reverse transcriptase domain-containing protein n=1 Tax=Riccia sorocarpa TaxID=122646 RepID=A0ABD3I4S9_9MARC
MRNDCVEMVQKVWEVQKLLPRDNRSVIKLLAKNEERSWLKNWRPISLLPTTYKIIAKIIACRLKEMMAGLVDRQQTGFIAGRDIIENVLSLRLAQEWTQASRHEAIFVKLDFEKAYDRVSHDFLWDTLKAAGMEADNVGMIKGLVIGGQSLVHVNGWFTDEFPILRGVRQGCPLAPLLFTLTTQPLMKLLRKDEEVGRIQGVNVGANKTLLHQLYADDTGISITLSEDYFRNLQQTIGKFEVISGAKLNINKSLIMPLSSGVLPAWIHSTCYEIAQAGMSFKYLGISTSNPVNEKQISAGIIKKMEKKLAHWTNRFLTWPGRTLLLKHVLAATPLYQLIIVQARQDGGLNWFRFRDKAAGLHIRCILKIITGENTEWSQMARSLMLRTLREGAYQREGCQWEIDEILLLTNIQKVKGSPTLSRMLRSWNRAKKIIGWEESTGKIPAHFTIQQGWMMKSWGLQQGSGNNNSELNTLKRGGIRTVEETARLKQLGITWTRKLREAGIFPEEDTLIKIHEVEEWIGDREITRSTLIETSGWKWQNGNQDFRWNAELKTWVQQLGKRESFYADLNRWWSTTTAEEEWAQRWRRLWVGRMTYRKKIWLWKLLQRGYFIGSRAADMGLSEGFCDRCEGTVETIEHVFWECRVLTPRKAGLHAAGALSENTRTLLEWIDEGLQKARTDPADINLLTNFLDTTWKERNRRIFDRQRTQLPVAAILTLTNRDLEAFPTTRHSAEVLTIFRNAKEKVKGWTLNWDAHRGGTRGRHSQEAEITELNAPNEVGPAEAIAETNLRYIRSGSSDRSSQDEEDSTSATESDSTSATESETSEETSEDERL